jgi:hypothetical protein
MVGDQVLELGREDRWTLLQASEGVVASLALLYPAVECLSCYRYRASRDS